VVPVERATHVAREYVVVRMNMAKATLSP
jgi:hypothetical protein